MRTKTLLLSAAVGAAGLLAADAQVYSVNSVGYVNKSLPNAGFHLISNPLKVTANTLNDLFPVAGTPTYTKVYKWNGTGYDSSNFIAALGWFPNLTLSPGDGAFMQTTGAQNLTFVGEVAQGVDSDGVTLNPGFTLVSSKVPQAVDLSNATFGFPTPVTNDKVYRYDSVSQGYTSATFITGVGWNPAGNVSGIAPGESFFFQNSAVAAKTWNRNFNVNN